MQSRYPKDAVDSLGEKFKLEQNVDIYSSKHKDDKLAAMLKLKKAQEVYSLLPEYDCGACGSPNCRAFSIDVADGKADLSDCVMLERQNKNQNAKEK